MFNKIEPSNFYIEQVLFGVFSSMSGNKIFSERIKTLKESKNLSTTQLADKLGIQKSRVSMWETNGTVPRQDMLFKLCEFFGVSADYLLGNDKVDGQNPKNDVINSIQRALNNMDDSELDMAHNVLQSIFKDKFGI